MDTTKEAWRNLIQDCRVVPREHITSRFLAKMASRLYCNLRLNSKFLRNFTDTVRWRVEESTFVWKSDIDMESIWANPEFFLYHKLMSVFFVIDGRKGSNITSYFDSYRRHIENTPPMNQSVPYLIDDMAYLINQRGGTFVVEGDHVLFAIDGEDVKLYYADEEFDMGHIVPYIDLTTGEFRASLQEGIEHPHINGKICLGNMWRRIYNVLEKGRLAAAFDAVLEVIKFYNPHDSYTRLSAMAVCEHCGEEYDPEDLYSCNECDALLCEYCERRCYCCEATYCSSHVYYCGQCDEDFCQSCWEDHTVKCNDCDQYVCKHCGDRCDCGARLCIDCGTSCDNCGTVMCRECTYSCEECNGTYCEKHYEAHMESHAVQESK